MQVNLNNVVKRPENRHTHVEIDIYVYSATYDKMTQMFLVIKILL